MGEGDPLWSRAHFEIDDLTHRVEFVRRLAEVEQDPERAHAAEDKTHVLALEAIQFLATKDHLDMFEQIGEIARIALSTSEIDFPRWTA